LANIIFIMFCIVNNIMKECYKFCLALFILICIVLEYKLITNLEGFHNKKSYSNNNNTSTGSNKNKLNKR